MTLGEAWFGAGSGATRGTLIFHPASDAWGGAHSRAADASPPGAHATPLPAWTVAPPPGGFGGGFGGGHFAHHPAPIIHPIVPPPRSRTAPCSPGRSEESTGPFPPRGAAAEYPSERRGVAVSRHRAFVVLDKSADERAFESFVRERVSSPGTVRSVRVVTDPGTGRSRGFAYVSFASDDAMTRGVRELDGAEVPPGSGRRIKAMPAEEKTTIPEPRRTRTREEAYSEGERRTRTFREGAGAGVDADAAPTHPLGTRRQRPAHSDDDHSSGANFAPPGKYSRVATTAAAPPRGGEGLASLEGEDEDRDATDFAAEALGAVTLKEPARAYPYASSRRAIVPADDEGSKDRRGAEEGGSGKEATGEISREDADDDSREDFDAAEAEEGGGGGGGGGGG